MKTDNSLINRIKWTVHNTVPNATILLYGSRAKGNATKNSDWDIIILVEKDPVTPEFENKITYPLFDLEFETGEIISPMVYSKKDWDSKYQSTPFYQNVINDSIQL